MKTERREHKRFKAPDDAVLLSDEKIFRLLDISPTGLCFRCLQDEEIPSAWKTSIIIGKYFLHIKDLPIEQVWEKPDNLPSFMSIPTKEVGVRFDRCSPDVLQQINELLNRIEFNDTSDTALQINH